MNTGYISSDFMEIRQHLAHFVYSKDRDKVRNYKSTFAGAKYDAGARKALKSQKLEAEKVMAEATHGVNKFNKDLMNKLQSSGRLAYATYLQYKSGKGPEMKGARGDVKSYPNPQPYVRNFENFLHDLKRYELTATKVGKLNAKDYEVAIANQNYSKLFNENDSDTAVNLMVGFDFSKLNDMISLYSQLKKVRSGHVRDTAKGSTAGIPSNVQVNAQDKKRIHELHRR